MAKKYIVIAALALVVLGGGALALSNQSPDPKTTSNTPSAGQNQPTQKDQTAKDSGAVAAKGSFGDYDQAKLANAENGDVVLFFSAVWCPTCRQANKNFNAASAPDGLTVLKLDYDKSTEIKQKYGVTMQHTFVQVDKDGKLLKKWHGSDTYDELKAQAI